MQKIKENLFTLGVFLALLVANGWLWSGVLSKTEGSLRVAVLDVGQGDAILIQGPTGASMLVDGGPDKSVLRELPKEMGMIDRTLDVVIATHPDKDHVAGLSDTLSRYRVGTILSPGIRHDTAFAAGFDAAARTAQLQGVALLTARRGMRIHLGGGSYADILYPDHDVTTTDSNDGSVVMRVVYGSTSFMLTGDAPVSVERHLTALSSGSTELQSTVLKAGHHGSRTSTDDAWLAVVQPQWVAISAGKDNDYGHPHEEVVARIQEHDAMIVSTAEQGTLHFMSDGKRVTLVSSEIAGAISGTKLGRLF